MGAVTEKRETSADTRIAYGANCIWWGSIHETGNTATHPAHKADNEARKKAVPRMAPLIDRGLPCCPKCGGMLFEVGSEEQWMASVDKYEREGHPGYRDFILWQRGKCFPNMAAAVSAYRAQGGMYALRPEGQA